MVKTVWGPTAVSAKGLISSHVPCHNSDADPHPYDPDLARQFLSDSSYGGVDNLPALMIDLSRPEEAELSRLMRRNWWKSNLRVELGVRDANDPLGQRNLGFILGVDLEAHELERRTERRGYVQFHHITAESWTPDPSQIVSSLPPYVIYEATLFRNAGTGYPVLLRVFDSAMSMPLDDPDRCAVFQAYEEEYLDRAHVIPIREVDPVRWLVQPWLRRLPEHVQPGLQHPHVRLRRQALGLQRRLRLAAHLCYAGRVEQTQAHHAPTSNTAPARMSANASPVSISPRNDPAQIAATVRRVSRFRPVLSRPPDINGTEWNRFKGKNRNRRKSTPHGEGAHPLSPTRAGRYDEPVI